VRTGEILAAAFWLAIALYVAWAGHELGLGTLVDPGPGFMFFWVGIVMCTFAGAALLAAVRQPVAAGLGELWHGTRWWLVPYVVVLLTIYALVMPAFGFMSATFAFMLVLFLTIDRRGWITPLLGALLVTATAYIVFHRMLGTQLPAGEAEHWLITNLPSIFGRS
jgi:putative tricarboxylic transport membrane protein